MQSMSKLTRLAMVLLAFSPRMNILLLVFHWELSFICLFLHESLLFSRNFVKDATRSASILTNISLYIRLRSNFSIVYFKKTCFGPFLSCIFFSFFFLVWALKRMRLYQCCCFLLGPTYKYRLSKKIWSNLNDRILISIRTFLKHIWKNYRSWWFCVTLK